VLKFGAGLGRAGGRSPVDSDGTLPSSPVKPVRVLRRSPVYPSGTRQVGRGGGGDVRVAAVKCVLGDGRFHSSSEVVASLSPADAAVALGELIATGYAIDVAAGSVRLRPRRRGEVPQPLLEVVSGLDLVAVREETLPELRQVRSQQREVVVDGGEQVVEGLVLSDPPSDLTVPLDWVPGMTSAILSTRGSGKTYLAGVIVEELRQHAPDTRVVVLDPTGASWGLAATAGGAPSDLGTVLLGGEQGVTSLQARSGRKLAELVTELGPRVVVCDLSGFSKSETHALAADFFQAVQQLPPYPLHVVLDEADIFVPQQFGALGGDQKRCSEMVHEYFLRGRKSGRGGTVVSLRPAVLSKTILSVTECLYLLRMGETHDLRAVEAWLTGYEHGVSEEHRRECLGQLPVLGRGTAYFLRGGEQATFRRFRVRAKRTYDSSRTLGSKTLGASSARCARPSADDLGKVRELMVGGSQLEEGDSGG
jgi:hypothetical protein